MAAADSLVGENLAISPWKEALAREAKLHECLLKMLIEQEDAVAYDCAISDQTFDEAYKLVGRKRPWETRFKCEVCRSEGFEPTERGCTFCDNPQYRE